MSCDIAQYDTNRLIRDYAALNSPIYPQVSTKQNIRLILVPWDKASIFQRFIREQSGGWSYQRLFIGYEAPTAGEATYAFIKYPQTEHGIGWDLEQWTRKRNMDTF